MSEVDHYRISTRARRYDSLEEAMKIRKLLGLKLAIHAYSSNGKIISTHEV